jgi:hypothetical protein
MAPAGSRMRRHSEGVPRMRSAALQAAAAYTHPIHGPGGLPPGKPHGPFEGAAEELFGRVMASNASRARVASQLQRREQPLPAKLVTRLRVLTLEGIRQKDPAAAVSEIVFMQPPDELYVCSQHVACSPRQYRNPILVALAATQDDRQARTLRRTGDVEKFEFAAERRAVEKQQSTLRLILCPRGHVATDRKVCQKRLDFRLSKPCKICVATMPDEPMQPSHIGPFGRQCFVS